jgi:hypothetical protein
MVLGSSVELTFKGSHLVPHIHISPSTSSGQCNCASLASHPQKSVTLRPQPGRETTMSIRDMWWYLGGGGGMKKKVKRTHKYRTFKTRLKKVFLIKKFETNNI